MIHTRPDRRVLISWHGERGMRASGVTYSSESEAERIAQELGASRVEQCRNTTCGLCSGWIQPQAE